MARGLELPARAWVSASSLPTGNDAAWATRAAETTRVPCRAAEATATERARPPSIAIAKRVTRRVAGP